MKLLQVRFRGSSSSNNRGEDKDWNVVSAGGGGDQQRSIVKAALRQMITGINRLFFFYLGRDYLQQISRCLAH